MGFVLTVLLLGGYMVVNFRRDLREARAQSITARKNSLVNG
jgi:hypothetical protein